MLRLQYSPFEFHFSTETHRLNRACSNVQLLVKESSRPHKATLIFIFLVSLNLRINISAVRAHETPGVGKILHRERGIVSKQISFRFLGSRQLDPAQSTEGVLPSRLASFRRASFLCPLRCSSWTFIPFSQVCENGLSAVFSALTSSEFSPPNSPPRKQPAKQHSCQVRPDAEYNKTYDGKWSVNGSVDITLIKRRDIIKGDETRH